MRRTPGVAWAMLALVVVALVTAGCSAAGNSEGSSSAARSAATIRAGTVPGLGRVLVDAKGETVYMFPPDQHHRVTCTTRCVSIWPPVTVTGGSTPAAGTGVQQKLLGTVPDPNAKHSRVVTYDGWPLYTYIGDTRPGQATGQDLDRNGGFWYVLRPSGAIVK